MMGEKHWIYDFIFFFTRFFPESCCHDFPLLTVAGRQGNLSNPYWSQAPAGCAALVQPLPPAPLAPPR